MSVVRYTKCFTGLRSLVLSQYKLLTLNTELGGASRLHVHASCRGRFQHEIKGKSRTVFSVVNLLF